jgi:hypothetical protein
MGFGVNSVADYLHLLSQGVEFEAVFCDTGCEWPETYDYIEYFKSMYPVTIITAKQYGFPAQRKFHSSSMYDWYLERATIPGRRGRDCSMKWKIQPKMNYFKRPCWNYISIDAGESKRVAKFKSVDGVEDRFNLIENEIDRQGCKEIISGHGLRMPPKSACYFCFNTKQSEWKKLRNEHPDLWCKALTLERANNEMRKPLGLKVLGLGPQYRLVESVVNENQMALFRQDEYPHCQCGL